MLTLEEILLRLDEKPPRVVSLVPSYTESMFDLGFGKWVMGVTDYCMYPAAELKSLPKVGGVRDPDIERILALTPDLVLANQEENAPETIRHLEQLGMTVWMSFPQSVSDALEVLGGMVRLYHDETAALRVRMLEANYDWAVQAANDQPKLSFFCPIWQGIHAGMPWWMTFNRATYASDLLESVGGVNVFASRQRCYPLAADLGLAESEAPGKRDTRYPCVSLAEVLSAQPEVILLPDEPFLFDENHMRQFMDLLQDTPAVKAGRVYRIDGTLIAWYGTRLGLALETLPEYFLK